MAGPRFLLLASAASPLGNREIRWRLVGANNRPLASSVREFTTVEQCRDDIALLKGEQASGKVSLVGVVETGLWSWRFDAAGAALAVSARHYQRQRECRYNADAFLAAVPLAECAVDLIAPRGQRDVRLGSWAATS